MLAETKDEMKDRILDAALRRFMQYCASKTTMNEIAEDLRCSKASLYYYFPDKKGLHHAVMGRIAGALLDEQQCVASQCGSAAAILLRLAEIKLQFAQRYCRLEMFNLMRDNSDETRRMVQNIKEKEKEMITAVIKKGIATGEFAAEEDPEDVALLYHQLCEGLRIVTTRDQQPDLDNHEVEDMLARQQFLTKIFVRGLKQKCQ
jgi:TetR/AcrR family transcriptional regulator